MKITGVFEIALEVVSISLAVLVLFMLGAIERDVAIAVLVVDGYWIYRFVMARKSWFAGQSVASLVQAEGERKTTVRRASRDWVS